MGKDLESVNLKLRGAKGVGEIKRITRKRI